MTINYQYLAFLKLFKCEKIIILKLFYFFFFYFVMKSFSYGDQIVICFLQEVDVVTIF